MTKVNDSSPARILILSACVGIVLGIGIWTSAGIVIRDGASQQLSPTVVNKTSALQIISTTKVLMGQAEVLRVTVKNASTKNIVSYTYLVGPNGITNSFAFSDKLFGPGETCDENIPLEKLQSTDSSGREGEVVFAAVWFDTGTGDGDPKYVRHLKDELAGIKEQATRILPLLRKAQQDSEVQDDRVLSELESKILQLPIEDEATQSLDYKSGRSNASRQMAARVRALREKKDKVPGITRKTEVVGNLASFERVLTRF
jgi:hypothetical protein